MRRDLEKIKHSNEKNTKTNELPYPNKYCFRLLGVILDHHWTFAEHIKELKAKAKRRLVILNKVGNTNWGFESRIMSITTHSLIESVTNYGLASFGRHLWDRDRSSVDTTILNKAARKVVGTGPTIRREILFALADMKSMTNQYILKAANLLDRTLRAKGTTAEQAARLLCMEHYSQESHDFPGVGLTQWETSVTTKIEEAQIEKRHLNKKPIDRLTEVAWTIAQTNAQNSEGLKTQQSIFAAQDAEILEDPKLQHLTFQPGNAKTSYETALTILRNIGWCPTLIYDADIFPQEKLSKINWNKVIWDSTADNLTEIEEQPEDKAQAKNRVIQVQSIIVTHGKYAINVTLSKIDQTELRTTGDLMGLKFTNQPQFIEAEGMRCSLQRTWEYLHLAKEQQDKEPSKYIINTHSSYWNGWTHHNIVRWKQYHTPYTPIPNQNQLNELLSHITNSKKVIEIRLKPLILSKAHKKSINNTINRHINKIEVEKGAILRRIPTFWASQQEVKTKLKLHQETHELEILKHLAQRTESASESSQIFLEWNLNREKIKSIMNHLSYSRTLQVTFANIIGATRFKTLVANKLTKTRCPNCKKQIDSWNHLTDCYGAIPPEEQARKLWLANITQFIETIYAENPAKPIAF